PSPHPPSSLEEVDRHHPLRVKLSEAQVFETDQDTQNAPGTPWVWVRMGSPIYNIDRDSQTAIAASMITRPKSVPFKRNGGDPRLHDHELLFYNLPDLTNPIARCGSDVWEKDKKTATQAQPWYHPFTRDRMQVAQVVEIKHYPEDTLGGMRVVVVIAFDSSDASPAPYAMQGRIVKLYSALEPLPLPTAATGGGQPSTPMDADTGRKVDCIAIFGIQKSEEASAMIIKKVLFCDDDVSDFGRKTHSNKAVSRGVTCMTDGRGIVWDWVHGKQITKLHMPIDKSNIKGDRRNAEEPANIGVVTGSTLATAGNTLGDAFMDRASSPRRRVYYWGVQVSADLDVSFPENSNNVGNNSCAFRIVTMAHGTNDEWESCWWNITKDELQEPMASLPAPPIIDKNKAGSSSKATYATRPPLIAGVKRISLSSRMGISMVDLEEPESSGLIADRQWITFLKEREDLIDIAIFGHNLVVTLKTGHLVWSFYGQGRTPAV
ncbi:hypothetical protein BGZ91_010698, partial [Linnemannia elongata]